MKAHEADQLMIGDNVTAFNGPYTQHAQVLAVRKDHRGIRWITYEWTNPKGERLSYQKRHMSVYLLGP